jgi:hypothetical protein
VTGLLAAHVSAADWPTYHGDNSRQGNDSVDPRLVRAAPGWTSAALDGAIYGQPVVAGQQVIVATEGNTVYSLAAATGAVQWSRHLGAPRTANFPCGNINPLGITSTAVIDGGNVYVVAEIQSSSTSFFFELASISLATGALNWTHNVSPPDPAWDANYQQQRGAPMATNTRIIVGFGGLAGDCGNYHGYVAGFAKSGSGTVSWWSAARAVPGDREGAVWSAGGLSQDAAGYVYAGTGNSSETTAGDTYDYSDGVIKLNPDALAAGAPVDYFAPAQWIQDNAGDVDLGSTTPLQLPNNRVFIVGKSGIGYLLNTANLGHIGGAVAQKRVCTDTNDAAFGSLAYANGVAYVSCRDGLVAVSIAGNGSDFTVSWHNTTTVVDHPPTIAGRVRRGHRGQHCDLPDRHLDALHHPHRCQWSAVRRHRQHGPGVRRLQGQHGDRRLHRGWHVRRGADRRHRHLRDGLVGGAALHRAELVVGSFLREPGDAGRRRQQRRQGRPGGGQRPQRLGDAQHRLGVLAATALVNRPVLRLAGDADRRPQPRRPCRPDRRQRRQHLGDAQHRVRVRCAVPLVERAVLRPADDARGGCRR